MGFLENFRNLLKYSVALGNEPLEDRERRGENWGRKKKIHIIKSTFSYFIHPSFSLLHFLTSFFDHQLCREQLNCWKDIIHHLLCGTTIWPLMIPIPTMKCVGNDYYQLYVVLLSQEWANNVQLSLLFFSIQFKLIQISTITALTHSVLKYFAT